MSRFAEEHLMITKQIKKFYSLEKKIVLRKNNQNYFQRQYLQEYKIHDVLGNLENELT